MHAESGHQTTSRQRVTNIELRSHLNSKENAERRFHIDHRKICHYSNGDTGVSTYKKFNIEFNIFICIYKIKLLSFNEFEILLILKVSTEYIQL